MNFRIANDLDTYELSDGTLAQLCPIDKTKAASNEQTVSIRLSSEVLDYFKTTGTDWQTRMSEVLKDYVDFQLNKSSR